MSHLGGDPEPKLMKSTGAPHFPGRSPCNGPGAHPGSVVYLLVTLVHQYLSPLKDGIKSSPAAPYFDYGWISQDKKPNASMGFWRVQREWFLKYHDTPQNNLLRRGLRGQENLVHGEGSSMSASLDI